MKERRAVLAQALRRKMPVSRKAAIRTTRVQTLRKCRVESFARAPGCTPAALTTRITALTARPGSVPGTTRSSTRG